MVGQPVQCLDFRRALAVHASHPLVQSRRAFCKHLGFVLHFGLGSGDVIGHEDFQPARSGAFVVVGHPAGEAISARGGRGLGFAIGDHDLGVGPSPSHRNLFVSFLGSGFVCEAYRTQFESISQAMQAGGEIVGVLVTHPAFLALLVLGVFTLKFSPEGRGFQTAILMAAGVVPLVMLLKMGCPTRDAVAICDTVFLWWWRCWSF